LRDWAHRLDVQEGAPGLIRAAHQFRGLSAVAEDGADIHARLGGEAEAFHRVGVVQDGLHRQHGLRGIHRLHGGDRGDGE
jgi:hypothetical protein